MSLQIGFATQFYTLWDVCTENVYSTVNGQHFLSGVKHIYCFIKNISMDFDKAKEAHPGVPFNEDLRGRSHSWDEVRSVKKDYPVNWFTFGQLEGSDIAKCEDVWQLNRAMNEELGGRRRVIARRRLLELGELVLCPQTKYTGSINVNWNKKDENGKCLPELLEDRYRFSRFALKSEAKGILAKQEKVSWINGHFFNQGEKVNISLREVERFSFSGMYGRTTVVTYLDSSKRIFKYIGSSPIDLGDESFHEVKATIKHAEYNDKHVTNLIRMKTL